MYSCIMLTFNMMMVDIKINKIQKKEKKRVESMIEKQYTEHCVVHSHCPTFFSSWRDENCRFFNVKE